MFGQEIGLCEENVSMCPTLFDYAVLNDNELCALTDKPALQMQNDLVAVREGAFCADR